LSLQLRSLLLFLLLLPRRSPVPIRAPAANPSRRLGSVDGTTPRGRAHCSAFPSSCPSGLPTLTTSRTPARPSALAATPWDPDGVVVRCRCDGAAVMTQPLLSTSSSKPAGWHHLQPRHRLQCLLFLLRLQHSELSPLHLSSCGVLAIEPGHGCVA
jgi:hypothetical protein